MKKSDIMMTSSNLLFVYVAVAFLLIWQRSCCFCSGFINIIISPTTTRTAARHLPSSSVSRRPKPERPISVTPTRPARPFTYDTRKQQQQQQQQQQQYAPTLFMAKFSAERKDKKKKKSKQGGQAGKTICLNRQARRNYEILETLEAGISLKGTEVKSIRQGKMNIRDAFARPSTNGRSLTLHNAHISKHETTGQHDQHEETRIRPLLVHRGEARKFKQKVDQQGNTIVPLKAYFDSHNRVKIELALCKGKNVRDKRRDIQQRDLKRETSRIMKNFRL